MKTSVLVIALFLFGLGSGQCQIHMRDCPPLIISASDVVTDSVRLGDGETNVYLSFRFEHKTAPQIKEIIRLHVQGPVVITDENGSQVARGQFIAPLGSNDPPVGILVGIVLSFERREQADKARKALTTSRK